MTDEWEAGTEPWLRRAFRAGESVRCPFCGQDSLILSFGDLRADNGRVEVYCDSDRCDAREIVVLVTRDATVETSQRPDVRALEAIETGKYARTDLTQVRAYSLSEIASDPTISKDAILARRTTGNPVIDLGDPWADQPGEDTDHPQG